jgi:hypothetical protein
MIGTLEVTIFAFLFLRIMDFFSRMTKSQTRRSAINLNKIKPDVACSNQHALPRPDINDGFSTPRRLEQPKFSSFDGRKQPDSVHNGNRLLNNIIITPVSQFYRVIILQNFLILITFVFLCVRLYREYFNMFRNTWEECVCMFFKNCFRCDTLYLVRLVLF